MQESEGTHTNFLGRWDSQIPLVSSPSHPCHLHSCIDHTFVKRIEWNPAHFFLIHHLLFFQKSITSITPKENSSTPEGNTTWEENIIRESIRKTIFICKTPKTASVSSLKLKCIYIFTTWHLSLSIQRYHCKLPWNIDIPYACLHDEVIYPCCPN